MASKKYGIAFWLLCEWLAFASACFAASEFQNITIGYSSFSGDYVPLWIAVEDQLGKKYG